MITHSKTAFPYSLLIGLMVLLGMVHKVQAQKVGLVLSGGGATGIAHVGVIKALEENNIPIDFIVGTSMGALVGGLYAAGYSPQEMERIFLSESFKKMTDGEIDDKYRFFFKEGDPDASLVSLKFLLDSAFQTSLPTNVISPVTLDFELMELLMGPNANANSNFDSLLVPYRCVAADIVNKRQIVFKEGDLAKSIRASMSYPFFLKPISINGILMFDGGLYNNFPTDVMYDDFLPDIIIGSNVSDQLAPPTQDNLISQIKNMLITRGGATVICENGILIEPEPDVTTFDFGNAYLALEAGYKATMDSMYKIKSEITRRVKREEVDEKRFEFRKQQPIPLIDKIEINGLKPNQAIYVRKILGKPKEKILLYDLKPKYYRMFSDEMINFTYPSMRFNRSTGYYDLSLDVKRENDLIVNFGGNFSSRPINTGFIGVKYNLFRKNAIGITGNSYFGKFYGSVKLGCRIDFPTAIPFYIEPEGAISRWDYFKSQATFFEDVKPSFLVQYENYLGMSVGFPLHYQGKLSFDAKLAKLQTDYYQTEDFTSTDTADNTVFSNNNAGITYQVNTLNRKQYASKGTYLSVSARYINGTEETKYGSTSAGSVPLRRVIQKHKWVAARLNGDHYIDVWGRYKIGIHAEASFSSQTLSKKPFFNNFMATMLVVPSFNPIPETKTIFKKQLRAQNFGAIGIRNIFEIRKNLEVRLEAHFFQPYQSVYETEDHEAAYGPTLREKFFVGSGALVFHSPLGPISFSTNYYHFDKKEPFSFIFNFGYILFNKRVLD